MQRFFFKIVIEVQHSQEEVHTLNCITWYSQTDIICVASIQSKTSAFTRTPEAAFASIPQSKKKPFY